MSSLRFIAEAAFEVEITLALYKLGADAILRRSSIAVNGDNDGNPNRSLSNAT
jgi:hypothetical protein